ncbi:unnamed protein product [Malus baccata var. baccata]
MSDGQDENPFGSSSGFARTTVQNAKFEVEKFDGTNNFGMWQCEVKDVLAQQHLLTTLGEKPEAMSKPEWEKLNLWACSSIRLCLAKTQKHFVMRETVASVLWQKLEDKYMTKSAENRLHLKKKLYRFQYKEGLLSSSLVWHSTPPIEIFPPLHSDFLGMPTYRFVSSS